MGWIPGFSHVPAPRHRRHYGVGNVAKLVCVLALPLLACGPKARTHPRQAAATGRASTVAVHIRDRAYVGWGAHFSVEVSTLSGPPLPADGVLGVAVGTGWRRAGCPVDFDYIEREDDLVIRVRRGDEADETCSVQVQVGTQRVFYEIVGFEG